MKTRLLKKLTKQAISKYGLTTNKFGALVVYMRDGKDILYLRRRFEGSTIREWHCNGDFFFLCYKEGGAKAELKDLRREYIENQVAIIRSKKQAII